MRTLVVCLLLPFGLIVPVVPFQNQPAEPIRTVPTFTGSFVTNGGQYSYTFVGQSPESGGTTTIPTVIVPLALSFEATARGVGTKAVMDAAADLPQVLQSPIFEPFPFANGNTQYGDAIARAQFAKTARGDWHTLLGPPRVMPSIHIDIPPADGYVLHSKRTGKSLAIVDLAFVQQQLFAKLADRIGPDKLLIVLTRNVEFYLLGDATVCCSVGTHGAHLDPSGKSAQAFVIGSYFDEAVLPHYVDIQALTEQLAEWMNDPLYGYRANKFPAWLEPPSNVSCGGTAESSSYLMDQPTDFLARSNATQVTAHGRIFHLENIALLPWFAQSAAPETFQGAYSFPDTKALLAPAQPCSGDRTRNVQVTAEPVAGTFAAQNGHALIGYWEGYSSDLQSVRLRDVSPQWDIVITTFAAPVKGSTSLLHFQQPDTFPDKEFKADIAYLQSRGRKVLISLGGGGEVVTLNTANDVQQFVSSVTAILEKYGFDGVDLDIETPSLLINPGDTDFRYPTTPSIVNLIAAMHQLRAHFGEKFMIAEVPEAAQAQAGMQAYGGQFGSFLAVIYGTRDVLSFVDAQDYNTPPLEGLDGNYYFPGTADYHVAMSEMLLAGFPVGRDPNALFPPLPPEKVAIGLPATPTSARNYTEIPAIENALGYLIEGKSYAGGQYTLRRSSGYARFLGAMFWAINEDRRNNFRMSNAIGPYLHDMGRK